MVVVVLPWQGLWDKWGCGFLFSASKGAAAGRLHVVVRQRGGPGARIQYVTRRV